MATSSIIWRPPQRVRPISIGVVRRNDEVLLMAVRDGHREIKGWRPPGGSIEFGERADQTVRREFVEEIGQDVRCSKQICVLENLYAHEDAQGHEIVFVMEAAFINSSTYEIERFEFIDDGVPNELSWVKVEAFDSGRQLLFPEGLLQHLA